MALEQKTRLCSLKAVVGKVESCPEDRCPFWEPGGAVLGGRCAIAELGVVADAPVATWLLEIREKLAAASTEDEEHAMRAVFHQLLHDSE